MSGPRRFINTTTETMKIEVAYAAPKQQVILAIDVAPGAKVTEAILRSGILLRFPDIDIDHATVGIFGKACSPDQELKDGDRIEIYRPLIADPKQARRARVAHSKP